MKTLIENYHKRKHTIKNRLKEFEAKHRASDEEVFSELCFCILTPQAKATMCDAAVRNLRESGLLFKGGKAAVKKKLYGVRFPNNKAGYLLHARKCFKVKGGVDVKGKLEFDCNRAARDWLVKNVKGLGYKEASHFLRNIGKGEGLAILDVHILKNLKKYKVIKEIPKTLTRKTYLEVEKKMQKFAEKAGIPFEELDLLFWSKQTGFVFK